MSPAPMADHPRGIRMKSLPRILFAAALALGFAAAHAADASCDTQATDKKLHGAAKTSFLKKCEKGA